MNYLYIYFTIIVFFNNYMSWLLHFYPLAF